MTKVFILFIILMFGFVKEQKADYASNSIEYDLNASENDAYVRCKANGEKCEISISPGDEPLKCKLQRERDVLISRQFYKLTVEGEKKTAGFPIESIPFLNQTMDKVKYHTMLDPVDSRWLSLLGAFKAGLTKIKDQLLKGNQIPTFEDMRDYVKVFYMHNKMLKMLQAPQYFSNPSMEDTFSTFIENHKWTSDQMFVEHRLAGPCPFLIKRVTLSGNAGMKWDDLKKLLNPDFDYVGALKRALNCKKKMTLYTAVSMRKLYVLYHEENNNLETHPDYFSKNHSQTDHLENITSPITLFAKTETGELNVVSIQWDYKTNSMVYTPESDSRKWMLAKSMVDLSDGNHCQAIWHLSHIHFTSSVYCAVFRSHFSELHPIYQIMRYHCEGTTPHIALTWSSLSNPGGQGHSLFSMGHPGFVKLAKVGYENCPYGKLAYDKLMKAHGLNLRKKDKLKYHPFRDDGKVIWSEFKTFASSFVDMFYPTNRDVATDAELKNYANEVSSDGNVPPYGGRGKIIGFPSHFTTKRQLKTFITRFMWIIAMHASINYPMEPWASFVPLFPTKLYKSNGTNNFAAQLPDAPTTMGAVSFTSTLGNLRINRIMDHYDKIRHERLSKLVEHHYDRFHSCIQKKLEKRNARRKQKGKMGFQYLEPKWLTNSIHI